jgi:TetR/AcrR family transcriptional repressor of mexJK operon
MSNASETVVRLGPQSARGRARRARILEAATDLFLKVGYELTSIDAILELSGGSKSTLYSYFPTKEDLFRAVIDSVVHNDVGVALDASGNARLVLTELALHRLKVVLSPRHRAVLGLIIAERKRFPDIARIYFERGPQKSHRLIASYLELLNRREVLKIDDAEEAAEFFIGMLLRRWYKQLLYLDLPLPSDAAMRERAEHVVARFMAAYRHVAH